MDNEALLTMMNVMVDFKKRESWKDKVLSWIYNSSNDFNKSPLEDDDNSNKSNVVSDNQTSNCSNNSSSDLFSASQQIRVTPPATKCGLLSNYINSAKKVYISCVKPTRRQLRRRQLPNLFGKSKKSKRKLSESICNLYTFINDVDVAERIEEYTSKRVCIPNVFNHSDNTDFDQLSNDKESLVSRNEPFSGTTSDTDWSENKGIDLKDVFVKKIRHNKAKKRRLKLRAIYNTKSGKSLSELKSSVSEEPTKIFSQTTKTCNYNKNISNKNFRICKENPIVNNEQIHKKLQVQENKDVEEETSNKVNIESEFDRHSNLIIDYNCNNNIYPQVNVTQYMNAIDHVDVIHTSQCIREVCSTNKDKTEMPTILPVNEETFPATLTGNDCVKHKIKNNEQNVNICSVIKTVSINCKQKNNMVKHDKLQDKISVVKVLSKKRKVTDYVKEAVPRKRIRKLKTRVNEKKKVNSIEIKSLMKRSILKSPGWSKLIDHMKELNILEEYKFCNSKQRKTSFRHDVISGKNRQTRNGYEASKSKRKVGNKKSVSAKDNNLEHVCSHSSEGKVVDKVDRRVEKLTTDDNRKIVTQTTSHKSYQINVTDSLNCNKDVQPQIVLNRDVTKDYDSNNCITRSLLVSNVDNPSKDNQSPSVISNSQPNFNYIKDVQHEIVFNRDVNKDFDSNNNYVAENPILSKGYNPQEDNESASVISNSQPTQWYFSNYVAQKNNNYYNRTFESSESVIESSIMMHKSSYPYISYLSQLIL